MKKMKKLAAMLIAVVMAMSLAVPAMAEGTGGTITVTSPSATSTTTYSIYKMFDIETTTGGEYKYKVTTDWNNFIDQSNVSNYIQYQNGYVLWQKATTSESDGAALAELAKKYVTEKSLAVLNTVQVGNSVSVDDNGYYLLVPPANVKSACGVVAVVGGKTVNVIEKTLTPGLPNVEKTVQEDSTSTYGDTNTVDIGQTVSFQTTINAANGATNYVLHDTMDQSFQLNTDSFSVTRDDNSVVSTSNYEVVTTGLTDGCTFHVKFNDSFCSSLNDNVKILVSYTAAFKPGATIPPLGSDTITNTAHKNTTWLTHTNEEVKTNEDSTSTYTYRIDVTKTDSDGNALVGAGFVLKDNNNKYYNRNNSTGAVTWVDNIGDASELKTTDSSNVVTFFGIDAENFTLIESTFPGGYTGEANTSVSTNEGNPGNNKEVTVKNTLGAPLPETGGMGTTIFYIAGSVLMLGAAVLLISKKRTKAE